MNGPSNPIWAELARWKQLPDTELMLGLSSHAMYGPDEIV